jgi:hypothetical protein
VKYFKGSFTSTPTVLVTAEHHRRSLKHDAASLWLEDVTSSSFKVCLRELQNFDGPHQDIYVVSTQLYDITFKIDSLITNS